MKRPKPRLDRFIARPGVPTHYSATEASRLLGFTNRTSVYKLIKAGHVSAGKNPIQMKVRSGRRWCIPRSELIRLARGLFKDRTLALQRVISKTQPKGALFVVTADPKLRSALYKYQPKYVSSLFGLGQVMAVDAAWAVLVDWSDVGRDAAFDMAERMNSIPDRPYLIGVTSEDSTRHAPGKLWDIVIPRPFNAKKMQQAISKLHTPIFG